MKKVTTLILVIFASLSLLFFTLNGSVNADPSDDCQQKPGKADSYVLALSSQAGFCQTFGYKAGKPECLTLSSGSPQDFPLTLHGLWPNQNACGTNYGFCNKKIPPKKSFCKYPPLSLSSEVSDELTKIMPSYGSGSCLERHEWYKHGSCQILTPDEYFTLAMRLTKEVDASVFGQYLKDNRGRTVKLDDLRAKLDEAYGTQNARKFSLHCQKGVLVDVYIELPPLIPRDESFRDLISTNIGSDEPEFEPYDSCKKYVVISNFTAESAH